MSEKDEAWSIADNMSDDELREHVTLCSEFHSPAVLRESIAAAERRGYARGRADAQAEHEQHEFVACGRCSCTTVPTTRYFMCEECARAGWPTRAEHEQQVREAVLREREECARLAEAHDVAAHKSPREFAHQIRDAIRARSTAQGEGTPS